MMELQGTIAPLITPFTDDLGHVSEVRLSRLVQWLIKRGVDGFLVNSDIGEFTSTSFAERKMMLELVIRDCRGALPVIANVTTLNTGATLDLAQHAARHGARAVLVMPPYYGNFTAHEHFAHLKALVQYATLPVILVDPQGLLKETALREIRSLSRVTLAKQMHEVWPSGPAGFDTIQTFEWNVGDAICSPLANIFGRLHPSMDPALLQTWILSLKDLGPVRLLKASYRYLDLEVGNPRSPFLSLSPAQEAVGRALVTMTKAKEKAAGAKPAA